MKAIKHDFGVFAGVTSAGFTILDQDGGVIYPEEAILRDKITYTNLTQNNVLALCPGNGYFTARWSWLGSQSPAAGMFSAVFYYGNSNGS